MIGGDCNARTGREGGAVVDEEEEISGGKEGRRSKDEKKNREGRRLVRIMEEKGWSIFNGNVKGDGEEKFTVIGGK